MVRMDQGQDVDDQPPVHRGLQNLLITGRSSDLSKLPKPSHPRPQDAVNGTVVKIREPLWPLIWPGFTAAGTVADSNGIPFSFHRQIGIGQLPMVRVADPLRRVAETSD